MAFSLLTGPALFFINNTVMRSYGKVTSLNVDKRDKKIDVVLDLKGESEPVRLKAGYSVDKDCGSIIFSDFNTSREWLTLAANDVFNGKPVDISEIPQPVLKILL